MGQAQRVTQTLRQMPREIAALMPYHPVDVLAVAPSQSLDALAQRHAGELPAGAYNALAGLGSLGAKGSPGGAALGGYLPFEAGFIKALMALGEHDAYAWRDELMAFFGQRKRQAALDQLASQCHNYSFKCYGEILGKQPQSLAFNAAD